MKYYPAFIDLKDKQAVVVGGGNVAERKVRSLLKAEAKVRVISPEITKGLTYLRDRGLLQHAERTYRKGDVRNAFIVVAGTSSAAINRKIADDADCLVNVVDLPDEGNFIVPSVIRKGILTIAISTEGASPAMSRAIRKEIEHLYGKEYAQYLKFVESTRKKIQSDIDDMKKRKKVLQYLASDKILKHLREKGFKDTARKIIAYLSEKGQL